MFRRRHPAQLVVLAFAFAVALGTLLLWLPIAREGAAPTSLLTALFTATSAVCVSGLVLVDTASYWSGFGEGVILALIQVGGFGIMTLGSLLVLFVFRRLGVLGKILAQTETKALGLGDVRRILVGVAAISLTCEAVAAGLLSVRLATAYNEPWGRAVYLGVFHAVGAFNNSVIPLYRDGLSDFVGDWWFVLTISVTVILGGLGFPVLLELWRERRQPWRWSVHTKVTLLGTALLLVAGAVLVLALEWSNGSTLAPLPRGTKVLAGIAQSVGPRSAGFSTLDQSQMRETTSLVTVLLMFIGGGSASTAGGIKITTLAVLVAMVVAEARGDGSVTLMNRSIGSAVQRQALSVAVLGITVVTLGAFLLMAMGPHDLSGALFEATSAFGTVGLSTGITPDLSTGGRLVLVALMFIGRVGPITLAGALAMRERHRLYKLPEERPIVG